jgi:hypothetical protein
MNESDTSMQPKLKFPLLPVLLCVGGWTGLALSTQNKLIGAAVAAFAGLVWAVIVGLLSKIWAGVEKTLVDLAVEWINVQIRYCLFGYRKRYLDHIRHRYGTLDVKGLVTQGPFSLEIEHVYVELAFAPNQASRVSGNPLPRAAVATGRHDIWSFLGSPQMGLRNFAILGAPGSGKTTLLNNITVVLAEHRGRRFGVRRTPVLLSIRDHAEAIAANPEQTIIEVVNNSLRKMAIPAPDGWFQREFLKGRCLVMLDGLDEVADSNVRKVVAKWVERQMEAFDAKNQFLITSRPFGYLSNRLSRVTVLEVCPFTPEQIELFIKQWYLANEAMSAQKTKEDVGVQIRARDGAEDLLKRLRATRDLSDLAVNPLLLTMIANVHRYRSTLPGRRVELYSEICEVFLGKRQQARGLDLDMKPAQVKSVLQTLAFAIMSSKRRDLPCAEAIEIIATPLSLISPGLSGQEFLAMVQSRSGLLVEWESGSWGFAHLTIQEYLAACDVIAGRREEELGRMVADSWWRETILLYVAQADATSIVKACISGEKPTVAQLTLAFVCLEEAHSVQPQLRDEVAALVVAGLEDADPEHARLAAETKLALRLRRRTPNDHDCYVDPQLISCAEYQLFVDERRAAGDYRQPDHWLEPHFSAGSGKQPVLGVRPSDAESFCKWLSARSVGEWSYQIPDNSRVQGNAQVGIYWARTPNGIELCGESVPHPQLTTEMLRSRLSADREAFNRPDHTFDIDRTLNLARAFDPALNHALALNRSLDLDLDLALNFDLRSALNFDLDLDFDRDSGSDRVTRLALNLDRPLTLALDHALKSVLGRARNRDLDRELDHDRKRARLESRILLLLIAYFVERGGNSQPNHSSSSFWFLRESPTNQLAPDQFLRDYVALVLLEERIEGRFPAFEGIRIMKVRKAVPEQY